jgi:hypothetical protein
MSTKPIKPSRSKLAVRLGAALATSLVVQRGRIRALLREAQHLGSTFLQVPSDKPSPKESSE